MSDDDLLEQVRALTNTVTHLRAICGAHHAILTALVAFHPDEAAIMQHVATHAQVAEGDALMTTAPDEVARLIAAYLESFARD